MAEKLAANVYRLNVHGATKKRIMQIFFYNMLGFEVNWMFLDYLGERRKSGCFREKGEEAL